MALESERAGDGLARAARGGLGRRLVAKVMPAQLPARHLGQRPPGGAELDQLVLLLLFAADALELVGDLLDADLTHEALELGVALRGRPLDRQRVREQLR